MAILFNCIVNIVSGEGVRIVLQQAEFKRLLVNLVAVDEGPLLLLRRLLNARQVRYPIDLMRWLRLPIDTVIRLFKV